MSDFRFGVSPANYPDQNRIESSFNLDSKDKEGVCYFLKSRLPTAQGMVNGRKSWR